jgi:hypothetical protein
MNFDIGDTKVAYAIRRAGLWISSPFSFDHLGLLFPNDPRHFDLVFLVVNTATGNVSLEMLSLKMDKQFKIN